MVGIWEPPETVSIGIPWNLVRIPKKELLTAVIIM